MFDFLKNIQHGLQGYFQPEQSQVQSTIGGYSPTQSQTNRIDSSGKAPKIISPLAQGQQITPDEQDWMALQRKRGTTMTDAELHAVYVKGTTAPGGHPYAPEQQSTQKAPQPTHKPTAKDFEAGFANFGSDVPVSRASQYFEQAAGQLPPTVDSLLPAIIALMESGGGKNVVGQNNAWNLSTGNGFADYPNYQTALLGGDNNGMQSQGFVGNLINNPAYAKYRTSGNLEDFFNSYTPPGPEHGNPTMPELLSRYQQIRQLFPGM